LRVVTAVYDRQRPRFRRSFTPKAFGAGSAATANCTSTEHSEFVEGPEPGQHTGGEMPVRAISRQVVVYRQRVLYTEMKRSEPVWGLLRRRECLLPTLRGWIALLFTCAVLIVFAVGGAHSFLAVNDPVPGGVLVVEGWLPDYALEEAMTEFRRDHYTKLFETGVPLETGAPLGRPGNFALTPWRHAGAGDRRLLCHHCEGPRPAAFGHPCPSH
jgi:hypothetical protein